jgi:hypothetical protein
MARKAKIPPPDPSPMVSSPIAEVNGSEDSRPAKRSKKEKTKKRATEEVDSDGTDDRVRKHKAVFAKFEHSSKISEKLKNKLEQAPSFESSEQPLPQLHGMSPQDCSHLRIAANFLRPYSSSTTCKSREAIQAKLFIPTSLDIKSKDHSKRRQEALQKSWHQ